MEHNTSFEWLWWILDALCIRKRLRYTNPELMFSRCHVLWGNKFWPPVKGKEKIMVKIGHPSISGAFDLKQTYWSTSKSTQDVIEEYFFGDWRKGQDIRKVVITRRFYQTSPNTTQAWFSNSNYTIKRLEKVLSMKMA